MPATGPLLCKGTGFFSHKVIWCWFKRSVSMSVISRLAPTASPPGLVPLSNAATWSCFLSQYVDGGESKEKEQQPPLVPSSWAVPQIGLSGKGQNRWAAWVLEGSLAILDLKFTLFFCSSLLFAYSHVWNNLLNYLSCCLLGWTNCSSLATDFFQYNLIPDRHSFALSL